ncbi:MAG TPA: GntR family transcriptional regulator [Candidatus Dormibacteraeota bacterium]|jgi:GntR family transcriptional regulator|nr:GntR family transcriptional regulator [Candidatus Dormibacteraeota bacterium]
MALIQFHLDPHSGVSFYVQLVQQVRQALLFGILKSGDQLPTVKEVSAQVALNPNTVLRAYRELEHDGLVISRPGLGTFVTATIPPAVEAASYNSLRADLERWIQKARARGVDDSRLVALFAHVLRENAEEVVA